MDIVGLSATLDLGLLIQRVAILDLALRNDHSSLGSRVSGLSCKTQDSRLETHRLSCRVSPLL